MDLSPMHNWCDRRCERCLQQSDCPVVVCEKARRQKLEQRGEDPDDWNVVLAGIQEDLAGAVKTLEAVAVEEGIDLSLPVEKEPTSLVARRLQDAGQDYVGRVIAILRVAPGEDVDELWRCAVATAMKLARLGGYLQAPSGDVLEHDVAPNRMLLERLDQEARLALEQLGARFPGALVAGCDLARQQIVALLERAFGPVPERVRATLEQMTAAGRAPSPFCVRAATVRPSVTSS